MCRTCGFCYLPGGMQISTIFLEDNPATPKKPLASRIVFDGAILQVRISSKEIILAVCKNRVVRLSITAELIIMNNWKQQKEAG